MSTPQAALANPPEVDEALGYWDKAKNLLDNSDIQKIKVMTEKFDESTKAALKKLVKRMSDDPDIKAALLELENKYSNLDIETKGEIQRLDRKKKDELHSGIKDFLRDIHTKVDENNGSAVTVSVDKMLQICREQQQISKGKEWKFKLFKRECDMHALWGGAIDAVDKFRSVGDTATSVNPIASLAWSAVKVLLQFAIQGGKEAGAIVTGLGVAFGAIQKAAGYEKQIQSIVSSQESPQDLEDCLVKTYSRILSFLAHAGVALQKTNISFYWHAVWSSGDIINFEKDILTLEVKLHQSSAVKFGVWQSAVMNLLLDLVGDTNKRLDELNKIEEDQRLYASRDKILDWLSSSKTLGRHEESSSKVAEGSGQWIFEDEKYKLWEEAEAPCHLWIIGIPGAGKTCLMSSIINHLTPKGQASNGNNQRNPAHAPDSSDNAGGTNIATGDFQLAYFYCLHGDSEMSFSKNVFRSYVWQLARQYYPLPDIIHRMYVEKGRPGSASGVMNLKDYVELLKELISRGTETVLILDALDECVGDGKELDKEIRDVSGVFNNLLDSGSQVKIIVSSRQDLRGAWKCSGTLDISMEKNKKDIRTMVQEKIAKKRIEEDENNLRFKLISEDLKKEILTRFDDKSQGMFQWAAVHIQQIVNLSRARDVKQYLDHMPIGLDDTYKNLFKAIEGQSGTEPAMAMCAFRWLLAVGSCELPILLAAVCQTPDIGECNEVDVDGNSLLRYCRNLVVIEGEVVRFSHLSVQDYIEQNKKELAKSCNFEVANTCARILLRYDHKDVARMRWAMCYEGHELVEPRDNEGELNELWKFANIQLEYYFQAIKDSAEKEKIQQFIKERNSWRIKGTSSMDELTISSTVWLLSEASEWVQTFDRWSPRLRDRRDLVNDLAKNLASSRSEDQIPSSFGEPHCLPNREMIFRGTKLIIEALVANRLSRSIHSEDRKVLSLALSKVVDLVYIQESDTQYGRYGYRRGRGRGGYGSDLILLFRLFLNTDNRNGIPLEFYKELAKLTLLLLCADEAIWEKGQLLKVDQMKVDQMKVDQIESSESALDDRSKTKQRELEKFALYLFDEFPDAHCTSYRYLSTTIGALDWSKYLLRAAMVPDRKVVEIFVSHGATIDDPNSQEWSECLIRAAANTDAKLLDILTTHVAHAANVVNMDSSAKYGSPLIAALSSHIPDNVKCLLEKKANVNTEVQVGLYGTALIAAVCSGVPDYVKSLLAKKAKVNTKAQVGKYGTALIAACAVEDTNSEVLEILLDQGVDVDVVAWKGDYGTALIAACAVGRVDRVKKLLRELPDVNKTTNTGLYRDALSAAADVSIRAVLLLVDKGAKTEQKPQILKSYYHNSSYYRSREKDGTADIFHASLALVKKLISSAIHSGGDGDDLDGHYANICRSLKIKIYDHSSLGKAVSCVAEVFGFPTMGAMIVEGFIWILGESTQDTLGMEMDWSRAKTLWFRFIRALDRMEDSRLLQQELNYTSEQWYKVLGLQRRSSSFVPPRKAPTFNLEQYLLEEEEEQSFDDEEEVSLDEEDEQAADEGNEQPSVLGKERDE